MARATLELPSGAKVVIEGTPEEVHRLLALNEGGPVQPSPTPKTRKRTERPSTAGAQPPESPQLEEIVSHITNCDDAEGIEQTILNKRSRLNRVLLPLFIVHENYPKSPGLTSGEISKVTSELGIRVDQPNASRTLSGDARKYVSGDKLRTPGSAVRYRLNRRGVSYIKGVIAGEIEDA
jgi:hypothetical protein